MLYGMLRLWNIMLRRTLSSTRAPLLPVSRNEWWGRDAGSPTSTIAALGIPGQDVSLPTLREKASSGINSLPEIKQLHTFEQWLQSQSAGIVVSGKYESNITATEAQTILKSALATMVLHSESRIAAFLGQGFYTIGPCGEELLAPLGMALKPTDAVALHYRHLSVQIARQLAQNIDLEEILLHRARAHAVSSLDPVTGGVHCSLGGGKFDFLVTSTLSSQTSPAVGRALGNSLAHHLPNVETIFPKDFVSFVSLGDGSVNHSHFLSGVNMAEYAAYRGFKAPVLFGISDNGFSISLKGYGWLQNGFIKKFQMPVFVCDGSDVLDVWKQSLEAVHSVRSRQRPAVILFKNIPRRFGHAATDRQIAYLADTEIEALANNNPIQKACEQFVSLGLISYQEILTMLRDIRKSVELAFDQAVMEPKISSREQILSKNNSKLSNLLNLTKLPKLERNPPAGSNKSSEGFVMRKHMTNVYEEFLAKHSNCVYIGEDVIHGGYYAVTEDLAKKFPSRIQDFPPEESVLIGCGMGYSQSGLIPIVEIPYAKYLDCGADMFYEAILMHWLSNGKQPNGMIIRLQGFDKGIFGGNFHTHNCLHIPPGLDVVCYSNGADYARGLRYAFQQAKAGRVVMTVDSTNLLNMRHLHQDKDFLWQFPLTEQNEYLSWDEVIQYGHGDALAIITYGNGVVTALQAQKELEEKFGPGTIQVVDSPYLSHVPTILKSKLSTVQRVLFADVCKAGQHPFGNFICDLQELDALPKNWLCVTAQPTYNPLGNTLTFLNKEDIVEASERLLKR